MDEKTFELYLQAKRELAQERQANTERALKAGRFQPFRLKNRDDRELWWDDLQVAWTVHAMDGTAQIAGTFRDRLLERWPQLEPGFYCDRAVQECSINRLRFRQCCQCREFFIGQFTLKTCSDACRREWRQAANTQGQRKRRQRRSEWRNDAERRCLHCDKQIICQRSTRRFCSDRCRKAEARVTCHPIALPKLSYML